MTSRSVRARLALRQTPADRDPDLLLIEQMLAPPPLDEARSSLDFWRRRRKKLPLHRRAARREAKEMAIRWQERVRAAEQAHFESSAVGRVLIALGISRPWLRRARFAGDALSWAAWAFVIRKLKLYAAGLAVVLLLCVIVAVTALVLVVDQLA